MKHSITTFALLFFVFSAVAQESAENVSNLNHENHLALQGYDPVAYFKDHKAVKGKKEFAGTYKGITYYFSSTSNKASFLKDPAAFEPQYGGWCAFAMGDYGEKVAINPETFKIINGKLYLFYNAFLNNTLKSWNKDEANLLQKADANWKNL
jgi:YHS domain-containing protein